MNNDKPDWHVPKAKAYKKGGTDQKFYVVMGSDGVYNNGYSVHVFVEKYMAETCKIIVPGKVKVANAVDNGYSVVPVYVIPADGSKVVVDREKWESMIDAVKKLEYSGRTIVRKSCPICDYVEGDGHAKTCEIGDALKRLGDEK